MFSRPRDQFESWQGLESATPQNRYSWSSLLKSTPVLVDEHRVCLGRDALWNQMSGKVYYFATTDLLHYLLQLFLQHLKGVMSAVLP